MKQKYHFLHLSGFFLIFSFSALVYADRDSDIDSIFNWAEMNYGNIFSFYPHPPSAGNTIDIEPVPSQDTKRINDFAGYSWHYRYYPDTKIYLGINDEDKVYLYNEKDELVYVNLATPILSITNKNNVGNGHCVNMPLIANDRKVAHKSSWVSGLSYFIDNAFFGTVSYTYSGVSDSKSVMTTLNIDFPEYSKIIADHYIITNDFKALSKIEIIEKGARIVGYNTSNGAGTHASITILGNITTERSYVPAKRSPAKVFCENQTWNSSYKEFIKTTTRKASCVTRPENSSKWQPCDTNNTIFEETENETFSEYQVDVLTEGNVEAINELKTTSAGTFNTVKINRRSSNFFDEPNSVIWLSTEYGVMVYKEDYNKLGVLEKTTELVSLE